MALSGTASLLPVIDELLEAHLDTIEMAQDLLPSEDWESHLEYLRGLHREVMQALAWSSA